MIIHLKHIYHARLPESALKSGVVFILLTRQLQLEAHSLEINELGSSI